MIRAEAESKNNPADLINVALEKPVESGLELPAFSTLDQLASTVRAEVNATICDGIWERAGEEHRAGHVQGRGVGWVRQIDPSLPIY